ncbi:hypothetical protein [Streptomyces cyaneofuscatus]|uniref:hypothetical protein n=1 Tax=Streptomyces cyaneofuscatus TaxID=66883 RepID=UPI002F91037F|nr:hypothetical protein OG973_36180 [Streptomyces cyaneofuscatus]
MTMPHLPAPALAAVSYEPWEGEAEALATAAEVGLRAAAWVRSLPVPPVPGPVGSWLAGELPEAIETAMSALDPEDCDGRSSDGAIVEGTGGVDAGTMSTLSAVPCVVPEAVWLTPDQQVRLLAVTSAVTGAVRLLVDDPGTAIMHGLLARLCDVITHAARTD